MNFLLEIDYRLLEIINLQATSSFLTAVMRLLTDIGHRPWLLVFPIILLWWRGSSTTRKAILLIIFFVTVNDLITTYFLKPFFARPRPCITYPHINLLDPGRLGFYGFPSNHAGNIWTAASLFFLIYKQWWIKLSLILLASLVCYSRVYVGVHYPLDVTAGLALGWIWGSLGYLAIKKTS